MKIGLIIISLACLFLVPYTSSCQVIVDSRARIDNINFYLLNNQLYINFDLFNAIPREKFQVTASIYSDTGKITGARHFRGDIGQNISAGSWMNAFFPGNDSASSIKKKSSKFTRKNITWDIPKDLDSLNGMIYVEIEAIHLNPKIYQPVSKPVAYALSTLYPGWGSSRTSLKPRYLLRGTAAYFCIAGSLYYSSLAEDSYSDYLIANTTAESDLLFRNTEKQFMTSRIFLFTAGAILLFDYFTIYRSENLSLKKGYKSQLTFLRGGAGSTRIYPGLSLVYNF